MRALTNDALGGALGYVMRRTADAAGVSGAVLRMRVIKQEPARCVRPDLVEALANDLWRAGFGVSFAPSWETAPGPAVGARGDDGRLREFLEEHPAWRPV